MEYTKEMFGKEIEKMIRYSRLLYERRLVSAAGGNVSVRCGENHFLITAGGASLRELGWHDVLLCDFEGRILDGDRSKRPSKEYRLHAGSYLMRPEIVCVVHIHPSCAIAVTAYNVNLPLFTASARLKLGFVPTVEEEEPGTDELAGRMREAAKVYKGSRAFLLKAHGAVILGESLEECFDTAELLEDTAQIALLAKDRLIEGNLDDYTKHSGKEKSI